LLSVLARFFKQGRWKLPIETGVEGQSLIAQDQLLTVTRGFAAPEARTCHERAESLCYSLNRPLPLYLALIGLWRYSLMTDKLNATAGRAAKSVVKGYGRRHLMLRVSELASRQQRPAPKKISVARLPVTGSTFVYFP
jgi:hypothetical protein